MNLEFRGTVSYKISIAYLISDCNGIYIRGYLETLWANSIISITAKTTNTATKKDIIAPLESSHIPLTFKMDADKSVIATEINHKAVRIFHLL